MFLRNLQRQCEPQSDAAWLANTDEGLKQRGPNGVRHTRDVVGDREANVLFRFRETNSDLGSVRPLPHCLAAVQKQVVYGPLHLTRIEPALDLRHRIEDEMYVPRVWVRTYHGN